MKSIAKNIVRGKWVILFLTLILMIPNILGYLLTDINYDILVYLPSDIETLKGQHILADDFNMGAFSIVITDNMSSKDIVKMEEEFRKIESVEQVISINDLTGTNIPVNILPSEITSKIARDDSSLIFVTFSNSTSDDITLEAVDEIRSITKDKALVGGMSAMVLDTKELFNSEMLLYVIIAVILCIIVLELSLDSYIVPFILMINIGIAILFNMGSNILFGNISYITKAIAAVLQLGVTTDFSIFLYHKYEKLKEAKDNNTAMSEAITDTFTSVLGSSLTTIAGFLALCTMKLTLGVDIGLVMAKGVLIGVICVLTVFPSLLLIFDNKIEKTKHKKLLPEFKLLKNFVFKHYIIIFIVFIALLAPAFLSQRKTPVYYKLDESIPESYGYTKATKKLKEDYGMVSQEMLLIPNNIPNYQVNEIVDKIKELDGIDLVLSSSSLIEYGITENMIPDDIRSIYETDEYKMVLIGSNYDIATDELNNQIEEVNKIIKDYDKDIILAGEGPLMKDLVNTTDIDFKNVNYTSILVIFILMMIVLKSISLPILLVTAIEFAIFINMGVPYWMDTEIPFIASVVIGTIQLGATIDYAILMTTKYLEERKTHDSKEAIKIALDNSVTSIFVSGMCFFAATVGVGIVSKVDMIGSLCILISRGAIISMLVVICIVPSILLIFDKLIMKTTILGGKNMKKKNIKKVIATSLVLSILFTPVSVLGLTKEETVYSKLNSDGSVKSIVVNEHLINSDKSNTLEDLTDLENIVNINSNDKFKLNNNLISFDTKGNDIFFQGTTSKELPVSVKITYKLDNKDIKLDKLIGKSGKVEINIKYTNNSLNYINVNGQNEALYTPFVVATVTNFNNTYNSNVSVTNGKVIDNGLGYSIFGITSPGLYESLKLDELKDLDNVTITLDTTKFELPTIYTCLTSKLIDTSDINILNKLNNIYGNVSKLQTSMNQIEEGSKTILDNLNLVSEGNSKISENLTLVLENLDKIKDGTITLDEGLGQILDKLNESKDMFDDLDEKIEKMDLLISADSNYISGLTEIKDNYENLVALKQAVDLGQVVPNEEQQASLAQLPYLAFVYNNFNLGDNNTSLITVLNGNKEALTSSKEAFINMATAIDNLNTYLPKIKEGSANLSDGTKKLRNGVEILNTKMSELDLGTKKLTEGMDTLNKGITAFNNEGIGAITDMANKAKNLSGKIEALVSLSNNYQSYSLKDKNTNSTTKFILVVDGKSVPKETKKEVKKTKKKNIIDKIVDLFR